MAYHQQDAKYELSEDDLKTNMRVKKVLKKLDKLADDYSALSDRIFKTSQQYHTASLALSERGGPRPRGSVPGDQRNNPLNFSHSSLRNTGVVPLVTGNAVNPPNLQPAPQQLQILLAPLVVKHPDDNIGMPSAVFFFSAMALK